MKLVLHDGTIEDVDTSFMYSNQYNTISGRRVYDTQVKYIIDDIRLGEFYYGGGKQGTYDEVAKAIAEERSKINKCDSCWWFNKYTRIKDECHKETIKEGNREIITEKTVYEISCSHEGKCVHDIDDVPKLFRSLPGCFFCEYPDGVPDMRPLKQFMIDNAKEYGIVPYWSEDELSINNSFTYKKNFGSYKFKSSHYDKYFELSNSRNRFHFYLDIVNSKFILDDGIGYKIVSYLGTEEYNHKTRTSKYVPIANYDSFAIWISQIVKDFVRASK